MCWLIVLAVNTIFCSIQLCDSKPQITDEQFAAMVQQAKEEQREKQKNTVAPKEQETMPLTQVGEAVS